MMQSVYFYVSFYLGDAMLPRYLPSLCVCPSVCPSVRRLIGTLIYAVSNSAIFSDLNYPKPPHFPHFVPIFISSQWAEMNFKFDRQPNRFRRAHECDQQTGRHTELEHPNALGIDL